MQKNSQTLCSGKLKKHVSDGNEMKFKCTRQAARVSREKIKRKHRKISFKFFFLHFFQTMKLILYFIFFNHTANYSLFTIFMLRARELSLVFHFSTFIYSFIRRLLASSTFFFTKNMGKLRFFAFSINLTTLTRVTNVDNLKIV